MNDFLIILSAVTLSGSLLFLVILIFDRLFPNIIWMRQIYLLLKVSLLYYCLPGVFTFITLMKLSLHNLELEKSMEIKQIYVYNSLNNIVLGRLFPTGYSVINIIFIIWFLGVIILFAVINIYKSYNFRKLLGSCSPVTDETILSIMRDVALQYKLKKTVSVYQCQYVVSPFVWGILEPKIIIPLKELSEEEWEIIFRHEFSHYRSKDVAFRMMVMLIQGLNWFNPLILFFSRKFYDYGELACDETVSLQLSQNQKVIYARLLWKLIDSKSAIDSVTMFSNNEEKFLKRRIFIIMKGTKIRKMAAASVIAFSVAIVGCPIISMASSWSAMHLHNEVMENVISETDETRLVEQYEHIEHEDASRLVLDVKIGIDSITRGANSVDFTLSAGEGAVTNEFKVDAGADIRILVSGDSSSDKYKVGIIEPSGNRRYVSANAGVVNHTFKAKETGTYGVYFENTGNTDIHILGTIYVN